VEVHGVKGRGALDYGEQVALVEAHGEQARAKDGEQRGDRNAGRARAEGGLLLQRAAAPRAADLSILRRAGRQMGYNGPPGPPAP